MNIKRIIYNIIKYPLILIFLKTPFINILIKRFRFYKFNRTNNIIMKMLDIIFQKEYYNKLKSKEKIRELSDSTLSFGEGKKWAQHYYEKNFLSLGKLKDETIYKKIVNYIKKKNLDQNKDVFIIQLGSSSGRDLEYLYNIYPKLNYISTDINDEILDFQKEKYNFKNLEYYKCHAEDIDKCINHFNLSNKIIIIFAAGSIQYVNPFFLKEFFSKISTFEQLNLFISEPISIKFIENSKNLSESRGYVSFTHRYDEYALTAKMKIIEKKIIHLFAKDDPNHKDTATYYLHVEHKTI
jgi:hypothetical protein